MTGLCYLGMREGWLLFLCCLTSLLFQSGQTPIVLIWVLLLYHCPTSTMGKALWHTIADCHLDRTKLFFMALIFRFGSLQLSKYESYLRMKPRTDHGARFFSFEIRIFFLFLGEKFKNSQRLISFVFAVDLSPAIPSTPSILRRGRKNHFYLLY